MAALPTSMAADDAAGTVGTVAGTAMEAGTVMGAGMAVAAEAGVAAGAVHAADADVD
ncbi:hypothetical protein [Cupriavidus laharis]|uniref:hypothetical protein n=1 Tax=Cupriavidus laharis TaxID=151654 RepID=UPI001CC66BEB|nr:hypothetical protein [Cupriavidus laharis]